MSTREDLALARTGAGSPASAGGVVTDLFTGTATMTVPIAVPAGEGGLTPGLLLVHRTATGNGPYGWGWRLPLALITRGQGRIALTDPALGLSDLVPAGGDEGRTRYRPAVEGRFARIEHVHCDHQDYWEMRDRDGLVTRYGTPRPAAAPEDWCDPAVVADPSGAVADWLVTQVADPMGHLIRYEYRPDRGQEHRWEQPLLSRVSYMDDSDPGGSVQVDFDYEARPDPFSAYRAGFERRTSWRCRAIRITTDAGGSRSSSGYRLNYRPAPFNGASLLTGVEASGLDVVGVDVIGFDTPGTPPPRPRWTFSYTGFHPDTRRLVPADEPALDGPTVALVDLPGMLARDLQPGPSRWRAGRDGQPRLTATALDTRPAGRDRAPRIHAGRAAVATMGPPVDLSDPRVRLADMTGDGEPDLVLLDGGSVTYWPGLGSGRWGSPVTMRRPPNLPDGYDPQQVVLGDVDGDGAADLAYLDRGRILLWGNQSGNAWTHEPTIVSGLADGSLHDLAGTGQPPYLLQMVDDHAGTVTRLRYAWSTDEYLRDQPDPATRWRTGPPVGMPVVAEVEVVDRAGRVRRMTGYRYRHGCADGSRGFATVEERLDSGDGAPRLARTWFHAGPVVADGEPTELDLGHEYSTVDPPMLRRPAALAGLSSAAHRAALGSLRGRMRRREEYGRPADRPTVTETVHGVRAEAEGVYFAYPYAVRISDGGGHRFTFWSGYDRYGLPGTTITVAVPPGRDPLTPRARLADAHLATYTTTEYAVRDDAETYLVDRVARTTGYEILNDGRASVLDLRDAVLAGSAAVRVIGHTRTYYDGDAGVGLPLGQVGRHGIAARTESLAILGEGQPWELDGYVHYGPDDVAGSPGGYYVRVEPVRRRPRPVAARPAVDRPSTVAVAEVPVAVLC